MKISIDSASEFRNQFIAYNRDNFSCQGYELLFDYLESCYSDYDLDVISICCDYSEDTPEDIANNYWDRDSVPEDEEELRDAVREYLEANTILVGETSTGFVYSNF